MSVPFSLFLVLSVIRCTAERETFFFRRIYVCEMRPRNSRLLVRGRFCLFGDGGTGNGSLVRSQKLHLGGGSSLLVVCLGRLRADGDGGRLVRVKLHVATAHAAAVRRTTAQRRTVSARAGTERIERKITVGVMVMMVQMALVTVAMVIVKMRVVCEMVTARCRRKCGTGERTMV